MANQVFFESLNAPATSAVFESRGGKAIVNVRVDVVTSLDVQIQAGSDNDPGSRFLVLDNGTLTTGVSVTLDYLPPGLLIRVDVIGVDGSANLFAEILQ